MSATLILHWPLDTVAVDSRAVDETDHHFNGTPEGDPADTPDAKFGSCLAFDGKNDALTLADNPLLRVTTYTAEAWISPNGRPGNWAGIVGKPGRNYCIYLNPDGYIHHRFATKTNTNDGFNTRSGSIQWGAWQHVAITNDGHTARTYIDGQLSGEYAFSGELVPYPNRLIVGRDMDDKPQYFYNGRLAHLRIYDAPLTAAEIQRDMAEDESALAVFVRTHPLDFSLYNADQHHVLYIDDDPAGQPMTLDITSTARQDIAFAPLGQQASPQAYHFELRFRAQTLAAAPQPRVTTPGWSLARSADGASLYLLRTATDPLTPGGALRLRLEGMNADGRAGSRGSRVELLYRALQYAGERSELTGARLQYLDIVNHRGLREIPLHVGFVGGSTVLNGGPNGKLRLRIANTSRDVAIKLNAKGPVTPASSFVVSFDLQEANETREWALIAANNAGPAQLSVKAADKVSANWGDPNASKSRLGQSLSWTLSPQQDTEIGADGSLILELSGLQALPALGHANIAVAYKNIPGYQDSSFVIAAERAPLLFWQPNLTDPGARLGIGLPDPMQRLDVAGNIQQRGFDFYLGYGDNSRGNTGYSRALVKDNGSRLTVNFASDFTGGVIVNGPQISLNGSVNITNAQQDANGNSLIIGPTLRLGYHANYGWVQSHNSKPLAINPIGNNVGIGLPDPMQRLDVAGNIQQRGFDFYLGYGDNSRGNTGYSRALVKDNGSRLTVNFASDFTGGVIVNGPQISLNGNVGVNVAAPNAAYRLQVAGTTYTDALVVNSGFQFGRLLGGHAYLGSHTGGVKKVNIPFPQAFQYKPFVLVTVRNEDSIRYNDTFAVTVGYIDKTRFEVNIMRMDRDGDGWAQQVRLHWLAWETTSDSDR
jgi:hypothetical protein